MGDRVKITYVTPVKFGKTLFAHARINLAKTFIEQGFDFNLIAPNSEHAGEILSNNHIPHRLFSWKRIPGLNTFSMSRGAYEELKSSLSQEPPDIVISELRISSKISSLFKGENTPILIIDDRSPPVMRNLLGKLQMMHYDAVVPRILKNADAIIVQNPHHREFLLKRFEIKFPDFIHCGGGVDSSRFSTTKKSSSSNIQIVYAGSLVKERGLIQLLDAVKAANSSGLRVKLVTSGKGKLSRKLETLSRDENWLDHRGFLSDKEYEDLLLSSDIGVVPHPDSLAWRICSPLKLKEYAAAGLVVFATDLPSHRNLGEKEWLFLLDANDFSSDFTEKIELLESNYTISELSKLAKDDSMDYSWSKSTEEIREWIVSKMINHNSS